MAEYSALDGKLKLLLAKVGMGIHTVSKGSYCAWSYHTFWQKILHHQYRSSNAGPLHAQFKASTCRLQIQKKRSHYKSKALDKIFFSMKHEARKNYDLQLSWSHTFQFIFKAICKTT